MPESGFEFAKNADEHNQQINRLFYDLVYFDDMEYGNDDNSADEPLDYCHPIDESFYEDKFDGQKAIPHFDQEIFDGEDYWFDQRIHAMITPDSLEANAEFWDVFQDLAFPIRRHGKRIRVRH